MNLSYRWLSEFFPAGAVDALGPEELARRLTEQGLTVDEVRPAFAPFTGVVLGKVISARPHPEADRLTLCTVIAGDGEREVVCGAPNVEVGAIYGYAREGARLPGDRKIRRARIRGVESAGMLCSAPELGLDVLGSAEGIWPVPGAAEKDLGRDLRDLLGLDDSILVVDVPSNRGDLLSHLGIAREVQWLLDVACALPAIALHEDETVPGAAERSSIQIEDLEGCPSYLGRVIEDVRIGPSPGWIQTRLVALGMRPVNNVVDATNYVMLECGQPLHPFDYERLAGGRIVVRRAKLGERFVTLDGKMRELDPGMTMIADAERAVAVGGVMGGLESEVADGTRTVFLESAHFDPSRVAGAARRLGITSEASIRFARGVDRALPAVALDRAAAVIANTAAGRVAPGRVGREARHELRYVALRLPRASMLIGFDVAGDEARDALEAVGFAITADAAGTIATAVPSWRFDVAREADLIEEIARLLGYDRVPMAPLPAPSVGPARSAMERTTERIAEGARAAGFDEARTPSFVGEDALGPGFPLDNMVEIRNPISKSERFLRPFVFTTLGRAAGYNIARGAERVKLFEIGHAFRTAAGSVCQEFRSMALAAAGRKFPLDWSSVDSPAYDFFDLKGDVEDVVERAAGRRPGFMPGARTFLHPGRQAEIVDSEGRPFGFCGELHPQVAETWGLYGRLYVAEWDLEGVGTPPEIVSVSVPRAPAVQRDLALVVPGGVPSAAVVAAVRSVGLEHLADIEVFDRYVGTQVEPGHYSLGVRLTFQTDRTLMDEEVDREIERLVSRLADDHCFRLR
jgi:phenylalanyl-tRNA synthetase beta chain